MGRSTTVIVLRYAHHVIDVNQPNQSNQPLPKQDPVFHKRYERYYAKMPNFTYMHTTKKAAGQAIAENEATGNSLAFQGTYRVWKEPQAGGGGVIITDIKGSGHHGVDYVGVASVRSGKGYKITGEGIQAVRQV